LNALEISNQLGLDAQRIYGCSGAGWHSQKETADPASDGRGPDGAAVWPATGNTPA